MSDWKCWRDPSHLTGKTQFGWPQCTICEAAPPYHERTSWLDPNTTLLLVVPNGNDFITSLIAPRSAMVAYKHSGDHTVVYYEGWIHGPAQYGDRDARGLWEAGVLHAADRMVTRYPTAAMAGFPADQLLTIGTYNPVTHEIVVLDEEHLNEWLADA